MQTWRSEPLANGTVTHTLLAMLSALLLSACTSGPAELPSVVERPGGGQLEFGLAGGSYACEQGVRVGVERAQAQGRDQRVTVLWRGQRHLLERDASVSGLPRFEDRQSGLVWIDLPWKSMLLDGRSGAPLATDCKLG